MGLPPLRPPFHAFQAWHELGGELSSALLLRRLERVSSHCWIYPPDARASGHFVLAGLGYNLKRLTIGRQAAYEQSIRYMGKRD